MDGTRSTLWGMGARGSYPVVEVELAAVDPPAEALRIELDADRLEELARSISRLGMLHPPGLQRVGERWRVVWGHRRTEAARLLGWLRMQACEVSGDADEAVVLAAAENLERSDMSPVEEAGAVSRLFDAHGQDVDRVARAINRSRAWVEGRLRLLSWPEDVQRAVHEGRLSMAAGVELAAISDDGHRAFLLGHAVDGGASARTCQAWRIAWLQSGVVPDVSVDQVRPGGVPSPAIEAELPCYLCGRRRPFGELTHVWLDAGCLEAFVSARDAAAGCEAA